ncbi:class I SAM-dependent methyltransferase [Brevibacillus humidisoli]|uniref:class I SAM-dependent methyltransferase n=1 Tax=Brevibacillus humidisoli TaxID=2895522 RepID=UPI001E3475E6|nr:class I SAM-dependent methyltransferase [Brevibacillus humidisoli]UFJ41294.1 class I SAM-dependent methyltransferase [Brevibacillus humidisoli]
MSTNNLYAWTEYYDLTQRGISGDLPFYMEYARKADGEVLDLACGTGRISIPLAEAGIPVTGIDLSEEMLTSAREKAEQAGVAGRIQFLQGDMRGFELKRTFPLIMIPFRSFLHLLHLREQMKALSCIRKHLAPGGKLVLNVFVPKISHLYEEDEKMSLRGMYPLDNGEQVAMWDYTRYDHFQQLAEVTRTYERIASDGRLLEKVVGRFTLRYIFPTELHHLLRLHGLKVVERFGSFDKTPFDQHSSELIIVAQAA